MPRLPVSSSGAPVCGGSCQARPVQRPRDRGCPAGLESHFRSVRQFMQTEKISVSRAADVLLGGEAVQSGFGAEIEAAVGNGRAGVAGFSERAAGQEFPFRLSCDNSDFAAIAGEIDFSVSQYG